MTSISAADEKVKAASSDPRDLFAWPIITREDEEAVLDVLRRGAMSGTDVTMQFEREFAAWQGNRHALGFNNGTAALHAAMYGCKVGVGDEIICPSMTYWASCLPCYSLGATPVFTEIDPETLCMDTRDMEHRISPRTKAIVVVHYVGYPTDMDAVMAVATRHGIKVIEDTSHAQGGLYKGRKVGTLGHVSATSLMSGKSLVAGEAGMLATDDREIYERAMALGHYERFNEKIQTPYLRPYIRLPLGGYKYRMHQMSAAVGRVQLKHYDRRIAEIQKAMNYFWDLLEGTPGLRAHRPAKNSGSTMGGWYAAHGLYRPEELGGLSVTRFAQAVIDEGSLCSPGGNWPLHLHSLLNECDVYGHGKPTRIAHSGRDVREGPGSLPVSERICQRLIAVPWFKKYYPDRIEEHARVFRRVAANYRELLRTDPGNPPEIGNYNFFRH